MFIDTVTKTELHKIRQRDGERGHLRKNRHQSTL